MSAAQLALKEWLARMAAMKQAIAELNLPKSAGADVPDIADQDLQPGPDSGEGIWDLISGREEIEDGGLVGVDGDYDAYEDSQAFEGQAQELASQEGVHNLQWLRQRCEGLAPSKGWEPSEMLQQLSAVLASDATSEELQLSLAELVGFDDLDFVIELISHREEILASQRAEELHGHLLTKEEREERLRQQDYEHKNAQLAPAQTRGEPQYPHVYKSHSAGNALAVNGRKYGLPLGSKHLEEQRYTEYAIPATKVGTIAPGQRLVPINEMDKLCQGTFKGYQTLNRMQSLLYPVAYRTYENMLICAPTGAGKTDAAMLTVLNTIARNTVPSPFEDPAAEDFAVQVDDFKIVYVAPMKALAAEVTEKLGKRLAWLGIQARELTGDMQLTKREIMETQIIVTTPEKWDVVTRKSTGDTELVQKVRLLIIDEVHMLHDERGAVIESLVARTQRQVESTQSLIRIVGLSATLPNYVDVADFLKVNRMAGLFFFDGSFRPVPLEQHFVGVKGESSSSKKEGAPISKKAKENLDITAFEKVKEMLELGHQVMVFVHSRKDTFKTAKTLLEMAADDGCGDLFGTESHEGYEQALRDIKTSKGRELRELVPKGLGIHHAGMPRTDRNMIERLFGAGVLKVLCCTATLAWGVNLPAAAVIIKGTQLYSAQEGKFVDLGILDVLQIFGRA
ncbi:hypothetical protein KEM55_003092, partial [Ascosphaera atra]